MARRRITEALDDRLVLAAATYALVAAALFPNVYRQLLVLYAEKIAIGAPLILVLMIAIHCALRGERAPLRAIGRHLLALPLRVYATVGLALAFLSAFTAFKSSIPQIVPFYADPLLARIDIALHGGAPWMRAHEVPEVAAAAIDLVYSRLWFGLVFGFVLYVALFSSNREFRRFIWAILSTFVVAGTLGALALSSVGPIYHDLFFGGEDFAGLRTAIAANPYLEQQRYYVDYLYQSYRTGSALAGSGISAMPSIHVGSAVLLALYLGTRSRPAGLAGWIFAIFIQFGSIYTGWHYAIDGYLSTLLVLLVWLVASWLHGLPAFGAKRQTFADAAGQAVAVREEAAEKALPMPIRIG